MDVKGSVVLVTGANRGLGRAFARGLLDAGAGKVYGGARDAATIRDPGIVPVQLDIDDEASVAGAAAELGDVTIVVNNAGVSSGASLLGPDVDGVRRDMETNFFGTLAVTRAFAPILERNGGGAFVNVLSVLSWLSMPAIGGYCASKAAAWSLTNGLCVELAAQGTLVVGVHCGYLDTDMAARVDAPKLPPEEVVAQTIDALAAGRPEVVADEISRGVRSALSADLSALYPTVGAAS
jgi:NAD(P)-dependent dehydrogenase (short-subunit alcohol dehydrogenase family)